MKSNKVRMNISRENHDWFKSQMGRTNDERIALVRNKIETHKHTRSAMIGYQERFYNLREENRQLKACLAVSVCVSIVCVGFVGFVQGWWV